MSNLFHSLIEKHQESKSEEVVLNLPKLKKVSGKSEMPKLKLPKLQKVKLEGASNE